MNYLFCLPLLLCSGILSSSHACELVPKAAMSSQPRLPYPMIDLSRNVIAVDDNPHWQILMIKRGLTPVNGQDHRELNHYELSWYKIPSTVRTDSHPSYPGLYTLYFPAPHQPLYAYDLAYLLTSLNACSSANSCSVTKTSPTAQVSEG